MSVVELPRNPVDLKIDALSEPARKLLSSWTKFGTDRVEGELVPAERFFGETPHLQELVDAGLVSPTGSEKGGGQGMRPTFDGWHAGERIACGIYQHHLAIEEARIARAEDQESIPGWGTW